MTRHVFKLRTEAGRDQLRAWADRCPVGWEVEFREATRTSEQNDKLWPMLRDLSKQVDWYGNVLTEEEWKDVMTAALKRQKVVPGIDGGFVAIGTSTRNMTKQEFSDLVELIYKFGAEQGVRWTDPIETGDKT